MVKGRYIALLAAIVLSAAACNKQGQGRRDPSGMPDPGNKPVESVFTENPDWTITYTGRDVVADAGGTFVVDVIHMKSTDDKTWFIDLVSANDFLTKYRNNLDSFIEASVKEALDGKYLESSKGDGDVTFDILDEGGHNWVAIAYGCDDKGNLTGVYTRLDFTTEAIKLHKDNTYKIEYLGRDTDVNGDVIDKVNVKTDSPFSYYVYLAYPEYVADEYGGSMEAFFNGVVDEIYDGMGEKDSFIDRIYDVPDLTIEFDRIRSGEWTVYAFGLDAAGNLTGNWSEASFTVAEEKPTDAFNRWLGTWEIGDNHFTYPIVISNSESNVAYLVSGWETGENVDEDVSQYTKTFDFEARFDAKTGDLVFYVQYLGYPYDYEGETYDTYLLGVYKDGKEERVYELNSDIARAVLNEEGSAAAVTAVPATLDGKTITFVSMRYADLSRNADNGEAQIYDTHLPYFPMTMTWVSSNTTPKDAARKVLRTAKPRAAVRAAGAKASAICGDSAAASASGSRAGASAFRKAAGATSRAAAATGTGRLKGTVRHR